MPFDIKRYFINIRRVSFHAYHVSADRACITVIEIPGGENKGILSSQPMIAGLVTDSYVKIISNRFAKLWWDTPFSALGSYVLLHRQIILILPTPSKGAVERFRIFGLLLEGG